MAADYMFVDTSDEGGAPVTDMTGNGTAVNQAVSAGLQSKLSPTRALVILWFVLLGLYWGLGYLFRRNLS